MRLSKYNMYAAYNNEMIIFNNITRESCKISKVEFDKLKNINEINCELYHKLNAKGIIVKEKTDEKKAAIYNFNRIAYDTSTLDLTIIPTMSCNFSCKYCFQDTQCGIMSDNIKEQLVKFLYKACYKYKKISIEWFGGEPLLATNIVIEVMRKTKEITLKTGTQLISSMTTNGYLLNKDVLQELVECGVCYYQISLDGDSESHNIMRPHKTESNSFETIYNNLKNAKKLPSSCRFSIGLRINVSPSNLKNISSLLDRYQKDLANDHRFGVILQWIRDWGGKKIKSNENLISNPNLCHEFYEYCIKNKILCVDYLTCRSGLAFCGARKVNSFVFHQDGKLYKCGTLIGNEEYTDINTIGYVDEFGNAFIDHSKNSIWVVQNESSDMCCECFYFPLCIGGPCPLASQIRHLSICHDGKAFAEYHLRNLDALGQVENLTDVDSE